MGSGASKPENAQARPSPAETGVSSDSEKFTNVKELIAKDKESNPTLRARKLPQDLQQIVDKDDPIWDQIYDGSADATTDTSIRYAAYASRFRTILISAQRYVAYTSDIGESFRPVAHPNLVRGAYAISWAYLIGDVSHEGYKAYVRQQSLLHPGSELGIAPPSTNASGSVSQNLPSMPVKVAAIDDYRSVMVQRAVFQSIASMGLPAFTIHSIVKYSGKAFKDVKNARLRTWGPIGLGLAAVPALPFLFDKPVEEAVEWTFHKAFETFGGPEAVGHAPSTGREDILKMQNKANANRDKEL